MKIVTVLGARPQFIKAAPVSNALMNAGMNEILVHTGQHFDANMSTIFFKELGIRHPEYNLAISGGSHGDMTGRMLAAVEGILLKEQPARVLVYGDTNSTLAGSLAAAKLNCPIAHVEAGLRSFNRRMPEEINRVVTDHISSLLFTPTDTATNNLRAEGIMQERIYQVGDVMLDAALHFADAARSRSAIVAEHGLTSGEFVLVTVHRQENTDDQERLHLILTGLAEIAREIPVVLPLHPRTRERLASDSFANSLVDCLRILPPVGYLEMLVLVRHAAVVATDSGGVQKEAYFQGTPCVTLREETEWVELVELGWNRLAPPDSCDIAATIRATIGTRGKEGAPFGNGRAADQIVAAL